MRFALLFFLILSCAKSTNRQAPVRTFAQAVELVETVKPNLLGEIERIYFIMHLATLALPDGPARDVQLEELRGYLQDAAAILASAQAAKLHLISRYQAGEKLSGSAVIDAALAAANQLATRAVDSFGHRAEIRMAVALAKIAIQYKLARSEPWPETHIGTDPLPPVATTDYRQWATEIIARHP